MKKIISFIWYKFISLPFKIIPLKRNRIVISCFYGRGFGDSVKYIAERLLEQGGYEIIWTVKRISNNNGFPNGIKQVRHWTLSELYYLSTAQIWIDNSRKPYGLTKRKSQFYIQTWHSSLRLKKIEKDAEKYLDPSYIKAAKNDSKMINLITSGCRFSTNLYKNSFWYNGNILECGTPRCDILLNKEKSKKLRKKICNLYNLDPSKKIILYAPTFRKDKTYDKRYLDCKKFSETLGHDYELLLRLHPHMNSNISIDNHIANATKYPDMQELICAVDYLITDYSGCCFDMMIAKKPCILYVPDLKQYLKTERELYFSFDELPFQKTSSIAELVNVIKNFNREEYLKNTQSFEKMIGLREHGNATKIITDIVAEKCREK